MNASPLTAMRSSVTSSLTVAAVVVNVAEDTAKFNSGEYTNTQYSTAILGDTAATILAAAAGGFVGGAATGLVVGLGVASIPAAIIGGVIGAAAAVTVSLIWNANREQIINDVAAKEDEWLGYER